MEIAGVDHLNLSVRGFEETVAWYRRVFRFALVEEGVWEGVRWGILRSGDGRGGVMLCIYEHPDYTLADGDGLRARRLHGVRHFGFRIEDEAEWRETLDRERLAADEMRWPHSTSWYVNDPTGYDIEVALWNGNRITFDGRPRSEEGGKEGA